MNDFEKLVKQHYDAKSAVEISNGSIDHAKILVKYLFELAINNKKDIKIMTGCLESNFYNNFTEQAKKIFANNNSISVISLHKCEEGSFIDTVKQSDKGNVLTANGMASIPHFILVDNYAYRLETDDKIKTAIGVFNNNKVGDFLNSIFSITKKEIATA